MTDSKFVPPNEQVVPFIDWSFDPVTHTPGPWVAVASFPAEGFECYWIKAQPHTAMRGFTHEIGCVNGPQNAENEATARLIAESPAMLAALQKIETILSRNLYHQTEKCEDALTIARTAIAKATGAA